MEDYVSGIKNNSIKKEPFWYADANSRPYSLNKDQEKFLLENFNLIDKIEYYDAWAHYYEPKTEVSILTEGNINLSLFKPNRLDNNGNIILFKNGNVRSPNIFLEKGNYKLIINCNSLPDKPINNENAHLNVKINGQMVEDFYLSENKIHRKT
ncbi:hypothetical protein H9X57_10740 [Flavobacterium piscinae]|uniref:hypothetical protein n=1 Tax=Flavobacterium piscinae TaxID=2506424 RepID=UPI00198AFC86|nr:hypothetical protein [Flavobacterium piscinae]MBC8883669.1 hypothetical protein [Flavobacterium piscinae]